MTTNWALASNGSTATGSSTAAGSFAAASAIDGVRNTQNAWGSNHGWDSGLSGATATFTVDFGASRTIGEIDVFTLADAINYNTDPTLADTFATYGLTDFIVQYWDGAAWQTITTISGNNKVWRQITFAAITTTKIRLSSMTGHDGDPRLVEIEAWSPVTPPQGVIAKYLVPRDGLHLWWNGDESPDVGVGSNITSLRDLTGNGFTGTPTGTGPLVDAIATGIGGNGVPGLKFTGTSPVRNTTAFNLYHLFVVAEWDSGSYTVDKGLVTGTATNGILQASASGGYVNFVDNGYSTNQVYRKAGVIKANSAMTIASTLSGNMQYVVVYELTFTSPLALTGIQIGADRAVGSTSLWPGRVYEVMPYTRILTDTERARVYNYFTRKYHAWEESRHALTDYAVFPLTQDWGSPFEDGKKVLGDDADAGSRSTRTKFGMRRTYDLKFTKKLPDEYQAVKAFYSQFHPDGKFVFRDRTVYPYEERETWFTIDSKLKATPNGHINFDIETTLQDVNADGAFA